MPYDPRLVDVVDLDDPVVDLHADRGSNAVAGAPRLLRLPKWPRPPGWWRRADPLTRWLGALAVVLTTVAAAMMAIAAAGLGFATVGSARPIHVRIDAVPARAALTSVDALGCPARETCGVRRAPANVAAAVRTEFPDLQTVSSVETYQQRGATQPGGAIYRRELIMKSARVTLRVVAQCRPGAAPIPPGPLRVYYYPSPGAAPVFVPAGQSPPPGLRYLDAALAGVNGCSLALSARADVTSQTADGDPLEVRVGDLVTNPNLMITAR